MKIRKFRSIFNDFAPAYLAEKWDSIGIQIGNPENEISKILFALQLDGDVLSEAIEKKCNLLFLHHPFIFQPISTIDTSKEKGRIIKELIKNDITVFVAHTNLDAASHGLNYNLANQFDFTKVDPFGGGTKDQYTRVIIYYPDIDSKNEYIEKVLKTTNTMFGEYSKCGFYSSGTGCFEPSEIAKPSAGRNNEFNKEKEVVIEFLVENKSLGNVLHTARSLHPYETPMIITHDVKSPVSEIYTLGKIGYFGEGVEFNSVLKHVKECFKQESIRYHQNHDRLVKKVGIVGGSGISMMTRAASTDCDLFITGDLKHHDWDLAKELGLSIIEVSHFVMEELAFKIFFDEYKNILLKYSIDAEYSKSCCENFNYI